MGIRRGPPRQKFLSGLQDGSWPRTLNPFLPSKARPVFVQQDKKQTMAVLPPMARTRKRRAGRQLLKTVAVELPAPQEPDFNPLSDNLRDQLSFSPRQCQLSKRPPRGKEKPSKGSERISKLDGSSWLLTPISVIFKSAVFSLWVFHRVT